MKKSIFHNSNGITLVEILATVVILSMISIFITNLMISSMNENNKQSTESKQITDSSYILKLVTKDLRNTSSLTYNVNEYIFLDDSNATIATYTFVPADHSLLRNSTQIANDIENFTFVSNSSYSVRVAFLLNGKDYKTDIAFRKGD